MEELFDYQIFGSDFLARRSAAGLFDDPGLGKSAQACTAWKKVNAKTVIVVCPASVRSVWKHEVVKWDAGTPNVCTESSQLRLGFVNIVSYEFARANKKFIINIKADVLVLDEAHYLKSAKSKRTKAIFGKKTDGQGGIAGGVGNVWALTGTPMPNNPSELWPMMRALFPDAIARKDERPMTYWQFVDKYCKTYNNGFAEVITGGKNLSHLRERITERCLRRRVKEVLKDLPDLRYYRLPIKGSLSALSKGDVNLLNGILLECDPLESLNKLGIHLASVRRLTGIAKVEGVIEWCKQNVDNYGKIVIFAHHKEVMMRLQDGLEHSVTISGATSIGEREKAVEAFQHGDAKYFIGNIMAAGTGITLTAANIVVFAEYSWVPSENIQAAKRIHRIGQSKNCLVYFATVADTIDESIMQAVRRKMETIKELGL